MRAALVVLVIAGGIRLIGTEAPEPAPLSTRVHFGYIARDERVSPPSRNAERQPREPVNRSAPASERGETTVGGGEATGEAGAELWPWNELAQCESGGNWQINTGNGFYGGLQFSLASWRGVGGTGYPHEASVAEQIKRAKLLQAEQGWGAWPTCAREVGLL